MKYTTMKTWVFAFIAVRLFIEGAEEFFILPTAWFYMESLGKSKAFLGLVMSAFSISAVIAGPIIGKLADRFGHIKCITITCFIMQVAGNFIYSIPISGNFPLAGRFVSGIGNAAAGVLYGQITIYTPQKYSAKVFIFLEGLFTLGATFGPVVSSFLLFHFDIFGWKIDPGNSPGFVLAIIWSIVLVVALFLPDKFGEETASKEISLSEDEIEDHPTRLDTSDDQPITCCNSAILCVFYQIFLSLVFSAMVTFYSPLFAQYVFHLQFVHIKLLFLNSSLFSLALLLSLYVVAEYFDERNMILFLNCLQLAIIAILAYFAFTWPERALGFSLIHPYILIVFICLGMPYYQSALGCSVLAKITHPKDAAFYQGCSYATLQFAIVFTRLLSGFIFSPIPLLFFCCALFVGWIVGTAWLMLQYNNLGIRQPKM